jgi:guanylate kinase
MKENTIIVLCGKSSSGKDTLASYFKTQGFKFVISHTTRPIRENESEGNPYYFISDKDFKEDYNKMNLLNIVSMTL